ncbi:hypothetical protein IIA79_01620, partial [bacterium]|nr:hypothetical protein [bacterium]
MNLRCDPTEPYSLLRPFSILAADPQARTMAIYGKNLGRLSARLEHFSAGTKLDCLYPLGNAYPWQDDWRRIALVGGGVGLAPLLFLGRQILLAAPGARVDAYFGGESAPDLVPGLLEQYDLAMHLSTMDGSVGFHGTVVELFESTGEKHNVTYT